MCRSMIGSLLYPTASRLDIMQAVGLVGRFQSNPKETHVFVVKRIFRYLQSTVDYGSWYTDADWTKTIDDRKNTIGGALFLGSCLVSWISKKQTSISLSIDEVEYIIVASCCTQVSWIINNLKVIQFPCDQPIIILCDNTSAINISKNPIQHSRLSIYQSNIIFFENRFRIKWSN
jgi:hypothetical protein